MGVPALVEGYMESIFLPVVLTQIGRADLQPRIRNARGVSQFWAEAIRYNQAANHVVTLGLVDLEQGTCASGTIEEKLPRKAEHFHLRIAVRMLESWLLADRHSLASFLSVSVVRIPVQPDTEQHPKKMLVSIARRSAKRSIREAMVPDDSGADVGPEYVPTVGEFIRNHWKAASARESSPSLDKACQRWMAV